METTPSAAEGVGRAVEAAEASTGGSGRHLRLVHDVSQSVLIAGGDPHSRGTLAKRIARRVPRGTTIEQLDATWQVLEKAPSSRLVMLAGQLDGSPPESVMQLLASRHPRLPVLYLASASARN